MKAHCNACGSGPRRRRCDCDDVWRSVPFALLKYVMFGHPRFLLRGRGGAQTEISLATMAYNLKRMMQVPGGGGLRVALAN